ncbi:MAG: FecR domain-containing protein [Bacteriovoracaceae bacterium]|nr:FecR domain-containing protein [Bacteriovoracaceae bacterium]
MRLNLFICFSCVFLLTSPLCTFADDLLVTYVKNKVEYSGDGVNFGPLKVGGKLSKGHVIRTADNSIVILKFGKSTIKITKNSKFKVDSVLENKGGVKGTSLFLYFGNLLFDFKNPGKDQKLRVDSESISVGVRGTRFFTHLSKGDKTFGGVTVYNGEVEVKKSDGSQLRLVGKKKAVVLDILQNLTSPGSFDWVKSVNWNLDPEQGKLEHEAALLKMMERAAMNTGKSKKVTTTNGSSLGLKEMFMQECSSGDPEACGKLARMQQDDPKFLKESCLGKSRYGCFILGSLDPSKLEQFKDTLDREFPSPDVEEKLDIKQVMESCFQGDHKSCFEAGKRKFEADPLYDSFRMEISTGFQKSVHLVLAKYCVQHNAVACNEFLRERMKNKKYAKSKGLNQKELDKMSGIVGQSNASSGSMSKPRIDIKCHYKEIPLLIKMGGGFCQARVVCNLNGDKVNDVAICKAKKGKCPDVEECILDDGLEVEFPSNIGELTILGR